MDRAPGLSVRLKLTLSYAGFLMLAGALLLAAAWLAGQDRQSSEFLLRYVPLTRKQFAVLEVLVAAEGGVVSSEELLERAWDENADPFTNAVRITVSALRKRLGEPWVIATVPGVGYRIETAPEPAAAGGEGE